MRFLTEDATLVCLHELGNLAITPSQPWVTVEARKVLVEPDPENRRISGCPNIGAAIRPCQHSLKVKSGYSEWLRIDESPIALDSVEGLTDGTPPGVVLYKVRQPGQDLVSELA